VKELSPDRLPVIKNPVDLWHSAFNFSGNFSSDVQFVSFSIVVSPF